MMPEQDGQSEPYHVAYGGELISRILISFHPARSDPYNRHKTERGNDDTKPNPEMMQIEADPREEIRN
jgi:hypothetical protein